MADLLSPQTWPFSLSWLPLSSYLVGGGVRDALRGKVSAYLDLDFVLPQFPVETAKAIANHYKAGFVLLDAERQIARVVFAQGTADFALQVGATLNADLHRRDFTVNAIAYNPHTQELIDPLDGKTDLGRGLLRMIAPENLAEDPLRLLRAYRQAAQLGFQVEPATQACIHSLGPYLSKIAPERVRSELGYLVSTPAGTPLIKMAWADGLFQHWLPSITGEQLEKLAAMDTAVAELAQTYPQLAQHLHRSLHEQSKGPEATRRTLLANAKLVYLVGQHPQQVLIDLQRLKYSRSEMNLVVTLVKNLPLVSSTAITEQLSRRQRYFLFQAIGNALPALVVLARAEGTSMQALTPLIQAWLDPENTLAHPHPLVTGRDLLNQLHLTPGPKLGKLLNQLEIAQAEGTITSSSQALELAKYLSDGLESKASFHQKEH
jgi:tRNA nucleotidyltransferase (CCA-adding enzyme)